MGHSKAVKGIDFSNDGRRFLTCSYDRWIKLWDTETGMYNLKTVDLISHIIV
jgi:pre-mRNA-processing factor 17